MPRHWKLPSTVLFAQSIQKVSVKALVQVDFRLDALSKHKQNLYLNRRTSGPVNAHLTPGPGIYFNALYMYIAPQLGQTTRKIGQGQPKVII